MKAVVQRTFSSKLFVDSKLVSEIPSGLTIFLAICKGDTEAQIDYFAGKMAKLRVFRDENGKINKNILEAGGEILLVSQFSLAGTLGKGTGNRPDFGNAELPDRAKELYDRATAKIREQGIVVKNGVFGAHMLIEQQQDGPLSFIFEC
ncbi:MAG: D-aminoacyl-tRNA deacylase [Clostridia bacterium]